MARLCMVMVAAVALSLICTEGTELTCFTGQDTCSKWQNVDEAEYGTFNGVVVCCPPEQNQAIILNPLREAPHNCTCRAGTAEDYAKENREGSSSSCVLPCVHTVLTLLAGCLLVRWY